MREADVLIGQGKKVVDVIKALGITDVTHYRWRQEYGGMSVSRAKRLREMEKENERLRKAVPDLTLEKPNLQRASEAAGCEGGGGKRQPASRHASAERR